MHGHANYVSGDARPNLHGVRPKHEREVGAWEERSRGLSAYTRFQAWFLDNIAP
jgi:hypothetical protein